jgi:hypothetical protein
MSTHPSIQSRAFRLELAGILLGAVFMVAGTASPARAADPRYRAYGAVPGVSIAHRVGGTGLDAVQGGADFVTVGKLDGNEVGPFGGLHDVPTIAKRFHLLVDWRHEVPSSRLDPRFYGYRALRSWLGARHASKQSVLCEQLAAEASRVDSLFAALKATPRTEHVFEVANEPNLYPYLSPRLYAWYYDRWHRLLVARAAAHGVSDRLRVMPAGLWLTRGLPASVLSVLRLAIAPPAADARDYYVRFLVALGEARAGRSGAFACESKPSFARIPTLKAIAYAAGAIDIANLHFYPWTHEGTSLPAPTVAQRFAAHLADLASFATLAATHSRTHRVWLTEAGNINPLPPEAMTASFVAPMCDGLEALSVPKGGVIERWYWFKAIGEDPKFSLLNKVGGVADVIASLPRSLMAALGLGRVRELATALVQMRQQNPPQGLLGNDGKVREFGAYYLRRAGALP